MSSIRREMVTDSSRSRQSFRTGTPVQEMAESRLRQNGWLMVRELSCQFRDGVLILRGRLPTDYLKQLAQTAVADLQGVRQIVNEIDVVSSTPRRSWQM